MAKIAKDLNRFRSDLSRAVESLHKAVEGIDETLGQSYADKLGGFHETIQQQHDTINEQQQRIIKLQGAVEAAVRNLDQLDNRSPQGLLFEQAQRALRNLQEALEK